VTRFNALASHADFLNAHRWAIAPLLKDGDEFLIRPRLFLADDYPELLRAVTTLLSPHFEIIGTARDGISLVTDAQRLAPDVVVVDITMPGMTGIDAVHKLVQSGSTTKFVFLTVHCSDEFVQACLNEGASGFVAKSQMKVHLIPAIRAALKGETYISRSDSQ
jgi:DNA-binding NarL/FixJ family response regulator